MKVPNFIFLIILSHLINCGQGNNPMDSSNIYSSKYFPLKVANTWYYDCPIPQTNPWAMKTIRSSFQKDNTTYFRWTYGEGVDALDAIDSIRADKQGNIWKLINGKEYLWFDFTQDSGSTYIFDYPDTWGDKVYYYNVYVRKYITCETPAGEFDNCILLIFDIPQVRDEEISYTFAPDIGLVRLGFNGWSDKRLTSAIINSSTIAN